MARRRKATPVILNEAQRVRLERLWFYYGNYGPATTPGNHQFIQGLLEHGLDLRPLQTKRTPKSERPTPECEAAVEAVLAPGGALAEGDDGRQGVLRLVPSTVGEREAPTSDQGLKELLNDIRHRHLMRGGLRGRHSGGKDAA
jgi:hypothetical protein